MTKLDNARFRIAAAMLSQDFTLSFSSHETFKKINKTHGKFNAIKLDEEKINSYDMSRFYE